MTEGNPRGTPLPQKASPFGTNDVAGIRGRGSRRSYREPEQEKVTRTRSGRKPLTFVPATQSNSNGKSSPTRPASRHSLLAFSRARTYGS